MKESMDTMASKNLRQATIGRPRGLKDAVLNAGISDPLRFSKREHKSVAQTCTPNSRPGKPNIARPQPISKTRMPGRRSSLRQPLGHP
jgi:hypothetical protein